MRTIVCLMSFAILAFGQLNPLSMEPNSWDLDSHPLAGYEFKDDVVRRQAGALKLDTETPCFLTIAKSRRWSLCEERGCV